VAREGRVLIVKIRDSGPHVKKVAASDGERSGPFLNHAPERVVCDGKRCVSVCRCVRLSSREAYGKDAPLAGGALDRQAACVGLYNVFGNGQSQAGPP